MGEIFANYASTEGLISRVYKKLKSAGKKQITLLKRAKDMNRHFSKEDLRVADTHMKKCSSSLIIREVHIQTTLRQCLIAVRMAVTKRSIK